MSFSDFLFDDDFFSVNAQYRPKTETVGGAFVRVILETDIPESVKGGGGNRTFYADFAKITALKMNHPYGKPEIHGIYTIDGVEWAVRSIIDSTDCRVCECYKNTRAVR